MTDERPRFDDRLASLLRTAAVIFADEGYHRASMREISRAAGLSLSGLYHYVDSKETLLFLIQDHCFGTVLENLERILEGVDDPKVRLRLLVENHLRFFVANMKEMKVLSHEAGSLTGEYRDRIRERKKRYTKICEQILLALRPAESAIDLRSATFSLFGMLNWIYMWYTPQRDSPVEELADDMSRLFLRGFLAGAEPALPKGESGRAPGELSPSIWRR